VVGDGNLRTLFLIPARGGSKGVPRKNARLLGGQSLVKWAIDTARSSTFYGDIVVSSDDVEILKSSREAGAKTLVRPMDLATDTAKSIDVVIHALESMDPEGSKYSEVCLLQPTTPFRYPSKVDEAIKLVRSKKFVSVVSVSEVPSHYNPHWAFFAQADFELETVMPGPLVTRRQELPTAYVRDGAIYVNSQRGLRESNGFIAKPLGYVTDACEANINIDTPQDWEAAVQFANGER